MQFLKIGLVIHMIGSAVMLTNPDIFEVYKNPENSIDLGFDPAKEIDKLSENIEGASGVVEYSKTRISFFHQQLYIAFLIGFAFMYLMGKTIYSIIYLILLGLYTLFVYIFNQIAKCCQRIYNRVRCLVKGEAYQTEESVLYNSD